MTYFEKFTFHAQFYLPRNDLRIIIAIENRALHKFKPNKFRHNFVKVRVVVVLLAKNKPLFLSESTHRSRDDFPRCYISEILHIECRRAKTHMKIRNRT